MSYVRVNITDQTQTIHDDVHGYFGDALIAALTAEPESVEELGVALARFIKPQSDGSPFERFKQGGDFEPYDAGVVVIDLAARVVASDSSYSQASAEGSLHVQSDFAEKEVYVPYRLSKDWTFVYSIPEYEGICAGRREEWLAVEPLDAREVLYGRALVEFIARECFEARGSNDEELFTKIGAKWLMTARDDLRGRTPREVLLERQDFIDFDLHSRSVQWSFTKECPPPLPLDSNAYRFAGFGTHEAVLYYELIRHLLGECFARAGDFTSMDAEVERLGRLAKDWLDAPDAESYGRTPAQIIESERKRVNLVVSAHESIIDEDCEVCQALSEDFDTPMFWHLDGCNMDEGFEFSFYKTREEFAEEEREREEFNREFERDWKAGKYEKPFSESLIDSGDDDGTPF
jgi:hypothetical protein